MNLSSLMFFSQGGASIEDRTHGWSLLHITAALGQRSACKWLLSRKLGVSGECLSVVILCNHNCRRNALPESVSIAL